MLAVALLVCAVAALTLKWAPDVVWTPDSLFYEARVLEVRGESRAEALEDVWSGPLASGFRAQDQRRSPSDRALANPEWIPESARLYDRRWFVPLLAAGVHPVFGVNSLEAVSVMGALVFALLLYGLLRMRFDPLSSLLGVAACLAWPALRWAFLPLTDSWGLALLTLALLAGLLYLDRHDARWLALWAVAILALSATRDITPVPIVAAATVALVHRLRSAAYLTATGALAALPVPLIFGVSYQWSLAYAFSGNRLPADDSWGFVLSDYLPNLESATRQSVEYLFSAQPPFLESAWPLAPFTVPLALGLAAVLMMSTSTPTDRFPSLMRGTLLGGILMIFLLPVFQELRYQYPLLPVAAAGVAVLVQVGRGWMRQRVAVNDAGGLIGPVDHAVDLDRRRSR